MMKNQITSDWIDRYNEKELGINEKALFESRMHDSPLLRAEVELDERLNHFLEDEDMIDLMNKISKASRQNTHGSSRLNYLLLAASLLCFAMIGGLFYLVRYNNASTYRLPVQPVQQQFIKARETEQPVFIPQFHDSGNTGTIPAIKNTHPALFAKKHEPLVEFELLIGSVMRADLFNLMLPGTDVAISAGVDVLFTWKADYLSAPVNIIILDNTGTRLAEIPVLNDSSYLLNTKKFQEGLYYWKIMVEDDLVFMGKLTILPGRKN